MAVQPTITVNNTDKVKNSNVKLENVDVVDGRLAFKSYEDLRAAYDKMFKNQKDLNGFESQFTGFTSQKQAYDSFTEADLQKTNGDLTPFQDYVTKETRDGEVFYERVVVPKLYAQLVNAEGLLQIKDSIYKFVPGLVYAFGVNDLTSYKANKNNLSAIPNVQTINFEVKKQKIEVTTKGVLQEVESQCVGDVYEYSGGKQYRKIEGCLTTPNPCCFFAWGAEITFEHRKRGFLGRWYAEKTKLTISGTVAFGVIQYNGQRTMHPDSPKTLNTTDESASSISTLLDYNYSGFEYLYFSPTSVSFTARQVNDGTDFIRNISF